MGKYLDLVRKVARERPSAVALAKPAKAPEIAAGPNIQLPKLAEPLEAAATAWTSEVAYDEFVATLARINQRYETAGLTARAAIVQAVQERERATDALFEQHDYESLRYCLLDLERAVRDALTGRG